MLALNRRYTESVPVDRFRAGVVGMRVCAAVLAITSIAFAVPPFAGAEDFLDQNCAACHSGNTAKARLDVTKLGYEPGNPDNFATWVKVHDRVAAGEMPPAGMPRPSAGSAKQFVDGLAAALTSYEQTTAAERGRAGLRRLNAYEYENAIR